MINHENIRTMIFNKKWHDKMLRHKKEYLIELLKIELKAKEKRTSLQNRALHLFFKIMADQLNNLGLDCSIEIQNITFSVPYTDMTFKNEIWRPIQKTMYGIESTKDINTKQINGILDVLTVSFGQSGIEITFPNKWDLMLKQMKEKGLLYEK
jgi:hypothetical protein